ncbi:CBS domain-containing protein [Pseudodesulfovibrio sediminis]|uniref:Membrane protein n=1 Tax=Pseudodesulfovibrio sediminis TaxID=2810563 RepID=A0ABN6EP91_9BACT|nr:CBS domain-containing protein [Pseudodesulfovibrio sediminis]BCS87048.1 membrane protein [Pseudodesulfovibrio sediminis]
MLTAKELMTSECITLTPETDIATAAKTLLDNKINGAPVIDDGKVVGVLCQSDLVAQQKRITLPSFFTLLDGVFPLSSQDELEAEVTKIAAAKVGDAMTPTPTFITPETSIEDIATMMANEKLYTLPVLEDGKLVGVVGKEDVLKTLLQNT